MGLRTILFIIVIFIIAFVLGADYEKEKFNFNLSENPGWYWIDATGERAYAK